MDTDEFDTTDEAPSNLSNALTPYSTSEAHQEAKKFIDDYRAGESSNESADLMTRMQKQADQARQILSQARDRLLKRSYDRNLKMMAFTSGINPSAGNLAGELAGGVKAVLPYEAQEQQFNADKDKQLTDYDLQIAGSDQGVSALRAKLMEMKRRNAANLASKSLTILGKEIRPGGPQASSGKNMSNFGKIAADENFVPGTPEFAQEVIRLQRDDAANRKATAGLDIVDTPPAEKAQLADQLGVPNAAPNPYAGLGSKQRQKQIETDQKAAQAYLTKLGANTENLDKNIQMAQRFAQLNETTNTSSTLGMAKNLSLPINVLGLHGDPGKALGQLVYGASGLSPSSTEMDKLQADMARGKRLPGERFTNYDQQMLQNTVPGRDKPYLTNKNLTTAIIQANQLARDHISFLNNYFQLHGHLRGAENYWDKYLSDNPIFDANKSKVPDSVGNNGVYVLNPKRQNYPDYFRTHNSSSNVGKPIIQTPGASTASGFYKNEAPPGFADGGPVDLSSVQKPSYLTGMGSEFGQGATFGLGDELMGEPGHDRARLESFSNDNPLSSTTAQMGGAAASALAARAALHKLATTNGKAGKIASMLLAMSGKYPITKRTVLGGTAGTIAGAGSADDKTGIASPMLTGGALGMLLSPFGSLAAKYALKGGRKMSPWGTPISDAEQRVVEALNANGTTPASMASQFSKDTRGGVPSMVGDLGGQPLNSLTQGAVAHPGADTAALAQNIQNRQTGSRGRVSDIVNKGLKPDEYFSQEDKLTNDLYNNSRPLYQKAYEESPDVQSKAFEQLAQTDEGQAAINYARKRMQLDLSKAGVTTSADPMKQLTGAKTQEELDRISQSLGLFEKEPDEKIGKLEDAYMTLRDKLPSASEGGSPAPQGKSLEFLDYVKKGMDSQINKAYRSGDNNMARLLQDHRNSLRDDLDSASPLYKDARGQYAGDLEVKNALKLGREDFDSLAPQELAKAASDMSYAEKDALRSGIAQRLFDKVSNPTSDVNYAHKILGSPATMDKLKMVFEKPSDFNIFQAALQREADIYESSSKALSTAKGKTGALSAPAPGSILSSIWRLVSRPGGMNDEQANSVAKILSTSDPAGVKKVLSSLDTTSKNLASSKASEEAAKTAGAVAIGAATMPNPRGYTDQSGDTP